MSVKTKTKPMIVATAATIAAVTILFEPNRTPIAIGMMPARRPARPFAMLQFHAVKAP